MLTLPNLLTLSRILAVPILVFLLWKPAPWDYAVTFVLYCIVGITDYFDGYLARAQGLTSKLGQFLDPIADKIMVASVIIMLMASESGRPPADPAGREHYPGANHPSSRDDCIGPSGIPCRSSGLDAGQPPRQVEDYFPAGGTGSAHSRRRVAGTALGASRRRRQPVGRSSADAGHRLRLFANRPQAHGLSAERL